MEDLAQVAQALFGVEVRTRLPITESFSSAVLSFIATDDRHYVVKRPWAPHKAVREAGVLKALSDHPDVPALLATGQRDNTIYLLIEGLDGAPWSEVDRSTPALLGQLGRSMRHLHATSADSFGGKPSWHELLTDNADRHLAAVGEQDSTLAGQARALLDRHLPEIPQAETPELVHFDLRPGNVLVRDGALVGLIDFESCRGGHGSMDFFKLWNQVAPLVPGGLTDILAGYLDADGPTESWLEIDRPDRFDRLMTIYSVYHGLAGLSWCYQRDDFSGTFPQINRRHIENAITRLAAN